ncbi:ABC transporter permease [Derxia gummosa]|uniref:ABC transporter permease n=1 Tax=Derxia gummosa DSM 723 TaxID=1121388 RepID=A0A8B6X733_9BURK|nr:ABC transporter permease [Derxia gummosa]
MLTYLIRRVLYAVLVLIGVNLLTFVLFFSVNTPDDMARLTLGERRVSPEAVARWKADRGFDKPTYYNPEAEGVAKLTDTIFFNTSADSARFRFGHANDGREIRHQIAERLPASLAIALPVFLATVGISIVFALALALLRGTRLDSAGVVTLVGLMSVSSLFFIILGQYLFSKMLRLMPASGFAPGPAMFTFVLLPVVCMILARLGPDSRLYRSIYIEELGKDYVRTARAKGLSEAVVLVRHVLRNSMIPIITASSLLLPALFVGSIVTESFFSIPGLGSLTIEGINTQDFNIVRAMVFFGSLLYVVAFLLTDIAYSWADPRIRLH